MKKDDVELRELKACEGSSDLIADKVGRDAVPEIFTDFDHVGERELATFTLLRKFDYNQQHTFTEDDLAFWKHAAKRYDQPKYEPLYAEFCGQISLPAVSSASPQRTFDCTTFIPTTTLLDGIGAE